MAKTTLKSEYPFKVGRVANVELAAIALKYSSRISELRQAGYNIICVSQDRKTGLAFYELKGAA